MQVLNNGLVAVGMSPYLQMVAIGVALSFAMFIDARRKIKYDLVEGATI